MLWSHIVGVFLLHLIRTTHQTESADYEDAVFAAMTSNVRGMTNPIKFNMVPVNTKNAYDSRSGKFYSEKGGSYWISLSESTSTYSYAQMPLWKEDVQVCSVRRSAMGLYKDGLNTQSRDIIVTMEALQSLHTSCDSYGLHSDGGKQTSLSIFRLSDLMNTTTYFSAARMDNLKVVQGDTIPFDVVFANQGNSFILTSHFEAPVGGLYFFSVSLGVVEPKTFYTSIRRNGEILARLSRTYYLDHTGDSTSRAGMFRLNKGDTVYITADSAFEVNSVFPDFQTSFSGFLYEPKHGHKVAWTVAKHKNWSGNVSLFPVPFEEVVLNEGNAWQKQDHSLIVPVSGVYYVTLTVGSLKGKGVHVNVFVNSHKKISLKRMSLRHTGHDMFSRSAILRLVQGDTLHLGAVANTGIYSTWACRETLFSGFLLFPYSV